MYVSEIKQDSGLLLVFLTLCLPVNMSVEERALKVCHVDYQELQYICICPSEIKITNCCLMKKRTLQQKCKRQGGADYLYVFSSFTQIEAILLRSAECEEVQRVAECCWHLARRTSEPRRRLWQGHCRKHKWELMAPLFRVIRRALHHTIWGRHYWVQLTSCTYMHKGGRRC